MSPLSLFPLFNLCLTHIFLYSSTPIFKNFSPHFHPIPPGESHLTLHPPPTPTSYSHLRRPTPTPLLNHSPTNTPSLHSDMSHYTSYITSLRNSSLTQYFTALRELSQIYLIDPKDAKELATIIADSERFGGIFRAEEVYEFAERRADWYVVKGRVEKAMYGQCVCM